MTTRRTVYLYPDDLERLKVLKSWYGLGTSAACRAGLALLLAHLQDEDEEAKRHALDTTVGPIHRTPCPAAEAAGNSTFEVPNRALGPVRREEGAR